MPKINNSEKLKSMLLLKIEEKKDKLFRKFSDSLTKDDHSNAWQEIFDFRKSISYSFASDATYAYVWDTVWPNIQRATMAKRDKLHKMGNEDGGLSNVEQKVLDIIGADLVAFQGLPVKESMEQESDKYGELEKSNRNDSTLNELPHCSRRALLKRHHSCLNDQHQGDVASSEMHELKILNLKLSNKYLESQIALNKSLDYKAKLEIQLLEKQLQQVDHVQQFHQVQQLPGIGSI